MRVLLLLFLLIPFTGKTQVNRSANQFAQERIAAYLSTKLLKDQPYETVSYGELTSRKRPAEGIVWLIDCTCTISRKDGKEAATMRITFYLDKRLKVVRAESNEIR